MSKRKRIKVEEKIRIAKACAQGTKSLNAAAEQLGIHQSVVSSFQSLNMESAFRLRKAGSFLLQKNIYNKCEISR